jgi:hypothetical protein
LFGPLATGATTVAGTAVMFSDRLPVASTAGIVAGSTWVAPFDGINGVRGGIYKVIAIPAPGVLQLDRPILWPFSQATNDGVSIYNGVGPDGVTHNPALTNFSIESPGEAFFEGQCVAYMNLAGSENCGIRGIRARAGGSGTGIASDAGFAFQIGYRNWQRDIYIDGHGGNVSNKAIPLVAQEEFYSERVTADEGGAAGTNWGVQDCVNCDFYHSISQGGLNGVVLATETSALSGIQSNRWVRFFGLSIVNPTLEALSLAVGASYNSFVGVMIARASILGISVNDGGNVTPCEQNSFVNVLIQQCVNGIHLINHANRNKFVNVSIIDATAGTDLIVDQGAVGNSFEGLTVNNALCPGARINVQDETSFSNLRGTTGQASTIFMQLNAQLPVAYYACTVRDFDISIAANSDAFYVPGDHAVLDVDRGRCIGSNAGTAGIQTNGGTARVGEGCDFSALGASFLNSAGYISRGATVQINGATPVPVAFPNLRATDRVTLIMRTPTFAGAQTFAGVAYTPGTGFTVTGFAGDTSIYDWVVI